MKSRLVSVWMSVASGLAWSLLVACPHNIRPVEPDPVAAVVAYRDALVEGRPVDAFGFIALAAREGLDRDGFVALFQRHRETLIAQARELVARARAAPPEERARVRFGERELELVRTPEGWRLLRPVGARRGAGRERGREEGAPR